MQIFTKGDRRVLEIKAKNCFFPCNKFSQLRLSLYDTKLPSHLTACNTEVDTKKVLLISYFYLFDNPRLFTANYYNTIIYLN